MFCPVEDLRIVEIPARGLYMCGAPKHGKVTTEPGPVHGCFRSKGSEQPHPDAANQQEVHHQQHGEKHYAEATIVVPAREPPPRCLANHVRSCQERCCCHDDHVQWCLPERRAEPVSRGE